jgi:regulator of replication initiation timing
MLRRICVAVGLLLLSAVLVRAQDGERLALSSPSAPRPAPDIRALADLIRDLQDQVRALNSQLSELRSEQQSTREEARELRHELDLAKAQIVPAAKESASVSRPTAPASSAAPQEQATSDRLGKLEDDQQLLDAKISDQYLTKVESGAKYRLRLSGIVLLNMYDNRGTVHNQDFPTLAAPPQSGPLYVSPGSFGGSLRQSQIKLQVFGPDIAGARTSADVHFDFAGGFPNAPNGVATGLVRLRTGTVRLDWTNTSIIAGQDRLFFAPLAPTSLATLATPALSYAGNLWGWTPQVRVERRMVLSESSSFLFQAGILDSLTGDVPPERYERYPSWGELSGQPAYATRVSWSQRAFGQNFTVGVGGYYGRQNWGFSRNVDGWAGTTDLVLPLGKLFEFTGEFYRGRAVAGFGGGIGQGVLFTGSFTNPATTFKGLDSMGGWTQLKFKPKANLEFNAVGLDNPFASELRKYNANSIYTFLNSRNLSPLINFIYQVRSDVLFSTEYRRLQTTVLDSGSNHANHVNLSLGYIF